MTLKALPNWEIYFSLNAMIVQMIGRSDSRQHQNLRWRNCSCAENNLSVALCNQVLLSVSKLDSVCPWLKVISKKAILSNIDTILIYLFIHSSDYPAVTLIGVNCPISRLVIVAKTVIFKLRQICVRKRQNMWIPKLYVYLIWVPRWHNFYKFSLNKNWESQTGTCAVKIKEKLHQGTQHNDTAVMSKLWHLSISYILFRMNATF